MSSPDSLTITRTTWENLFDDFGRVVQTTATTTGTSHDNYGFWMGQLQSLTPAERLSEPMLAVSVARRNLADPGLGIELSHEITLPVPNPTSLMVHLEDTMPGDVPSDYLVPGASQYVNSFWRPEAFGSSSEPATGLAPEAGREMHVVLNFPPDALEAVNAAIADSSNVIRVEINVCRDKQGQNDDPHLVSSGSWGQPHDDQWAIKRVGFSEEPDSAWRLAEEATTPVVVAVIDTGLDWTHPDISWDSIWNNEGEIAGNGLDDDGNGYVDDVIGWDFIGDTNTPWDNDGHGTFVSGVIAAAQDNAIGIAGINPNAKIMVLKALNDFGHSRASDLAQAIIYAADNGARIVNLSVGGMDLTRTEQTAIDYAHAKGALIIAAAGNESVDVAEFGPAGSDRVLTVASTGFEDERVPFSNWGAAVDIAAPGVDVLSLRARRTDLLRDIPGVEYQAGDGFVGEDDQYYRASGTSFSAPIVAGTASLILSSDPSLTNAQVERMLLHSTRDVEVPGKDQYAGFGLLDARAALTADPAYMLLAEIGGVEVLTREGETFLQVNGTLDADELRRGWLEIGQGTEPTSWKTVADELTQPIRNGIVGLIPASEFGGAAVWTIRLRAEHADGRQHQAWFELNIG